MGQRMMRSSLTLRRRPHMTGKTCVCESRRSQLPCSWLHRREDFARVRSRREQSRSTMMTSGASSPANVGRGWSLGDRRDHGLAHSPDQERGDRRPGPLPVAGPSEGELPRLGAGYGLVDSAKVQSLRQASGSQGSARTESKRSGAILPGAVLALAAPTAAEERLPRHGGQRQRDFGNAQKPGRLDSPDRQHGRLYRLSSDGNKATREIPRASASSKIQ